MVPAARRQRGTDRFSWARRDSRAKHWRGSVLKARASLGPETTFTFADMSSHTSAQSQYREPAKLDSRPLRRSPA